MVDWKTIGNSCQTVSPPKKLDKELYNDIGLYPIIDQGQKDIIGYTNDASALVPKDKYVLFGDHTRYVKYHEGQFAQGADGLKILKANEILLPKYFFYVFQNTEVPSRGYSRHWSIAKDIEIPIPSLSEQTRIVDILDAFTASIENLKEQIAQRRKQYEYYRDQLLDLEGKQGVKKMMLGDLCLKTQNIKWKSEPTEKFFFYIDLSSVDIDLNNITETIEINKDSAPSRAQQIVKTDDVLLGTTRPTLKRYCQVPMRYNNQICSTGYCVFRANTAIVLSRWLFHNIGNGRFWDYCELKQQGAGYPCLSNSDAFAYSIPVPSKEEQSRIVSILDTFESSIQNLEAQLKEREKQYEYYRNKLLTFE